MLAADHAARTKTPIVVVKVGRTDEGRSMAKAHTGHRDGERFRDAMEAVAQAQADGRAVFPISDSTFLEVSKIGQFRQRRDLRDVIEVVSGYFVVTSRGVIAKHEIEAAPVDEDVNQRPLA